MADKSPSEILHEEIAPLICTGARKVEHVDWDEIEKFIAPVARYFDGLIRLGYLEGGAFLATTPGNDRPSLIVHDDCTEVWVSAPIEAMPVNEKERANVE